MTANVINQVPYVRTSRQFPFDDVALLAMEINKAYIDIANVVNNRVIGLFPVNRPAITGESYFLVKIKDNKHFDKSIHLRQQHQSIIILKSLILINLHYVLEVIPMD